MYRHQRRIALPVGAITLALSLSACSIGLTSDSASSAKSASTGNSHSATQGGEIPAGWKKVTAKTAGISLAVPEDWAGLGDDVDEETATANLEQIANEEALSKIVSEQRTGSDILYITPGPATSSFEMIEVSSDLESAEKITSIETLKETLPSTSRELARNIEEIDTPLGKGYVFDAEIEGLKFKDLYVPNNKGQFVEVLFLALDEDTVTQRYEAVLKTLSVE